MIVADFRFTLLTLLLCAVSTTWAEEAVLYYGVDNGANSITVNDFTIAITGNTSKKWSGGADITYNANTYKSLKNSNGAQNTVTCPTGKVATSVDFYAIPNTDNKGPKLTEFDGETCDVAVTTTKDGTKPTKITKSLNYKSSFTFTFGNEQANIILVVTYQNAPADVVANPTFTQTGNSVEMACATVGAKIYYTTDGTEPTTLSNLYSSAVELTSPSTIRAKAFNGENNEYSSDEVTRDCYFFHDGSLAVLGYNGGTLNGDKNVWTSENGYFMLTDETAERTIGYSNLAGNQDGFKLNANDVYTIQPSEDIKVTKIIVIGKTWLTGAASSIAFDGFSPADGQAFYTADENRNTFIKSYEFTPTAEQKYGQAITMRPGGNQLGAYIEVYGVKRSGPATPVSKETVTQTVTFDANGAVCSDANIVTMSGGGLKDPTYTGYTKAMEMSSNATITINLPEGSTNASVTLFGTNASTALKLNSDSKTSVTWSGDDTNGYTLNIPIADSNAGKTYTITKGDGASRIHKITLTYQIGSDDKISLTTTTNMAGWRAFYDAENSYSVDENTTVYVAASEPADGSISLTSIEGIPAGIPVILHTTSSADSYKMTLTKATVDGYDGTNKLQYTKSAVSNVYRLGYGADGVGFYPYSGTPTSGAVILNVSSANAGNAKALTFSFGDVTGISNAAAAEAANAGTDKMYNLSGQIVGEGYKGIVIVNGKKVIK